VSLVAVCSTLSGGRSVIELGARLITGRWASSPALQMFSNNVCIELVLQPEIDGGIRT
jgi:hypothetical protein